MITNELMRQLLTDIPAADQRHLVTVVDRNHAEQLARKRRAQAAPDEASDPFGDDVDDVD
ncbi:MAG: hypothetical protein QOJ32_3048 [Frankiaceae bacterium]|jgi:hypothetical protein|nr:hypothetical protein [Frankiaceae bacterium]MDQ1636239.1 hypothetical protein [Frankiaceae bacterium]MDQ1650423.1 hypothetical protein [Frankiaceae bacterium]